MAMEIGPQLQLLLNVFHFFIGCLARPVSIAGQGIPADFDIADVVDSRPEVLGEVPSVPPGAREMMGRDARIL